MDFEFFGGTPRLVYTEVSGGPPDLLSAPYDSNPQLAYESGALWQFLRSSAVYRCPADRTNEVAWRQRPQKLSTYVENGAICGYGANGSRTYAQSAFRPEAFMLWEPEDGVTSTGYSYYNDASSYPDPAVDGGLGRRHDKRGGLVLDFSGSVQFIRFETWNTEARSLSKNRLWCNPGTANGH